MSGLPRQAWSPKEVGEQLGLPYETVLGLIHNGQLGAFKAGRYYRIPDAELKRLLDEAANNRNAA